MFKFKLRFSIIIFLVFIAFTIIGTLSHEYGHILVAKSLGYNTHLSYSSMSYKEKGYYEDAEVKEIFSIVDLYHHEINNNLPFKEKKRFNTLKHSLEKKYQPNFKHIFWIALGGPLQTILTSLIGLCILFYRKTSTKHKLKFLDWLAILLACFISREVYNTFGALVSKFINKERFFTGDEFEISRYLELNQWVIPIITALIGACVMYYILFNVVPKAYRFSFIVSGFFGGISGFVFWNNFLGPIVLP